MLPGEHHTLHPLSRAWIRCVSASVLEASVREEALKKRILIIDDDQLILYGLAKVLTDDFHEVKTVTTATAALDELAASCYDLCLLDLHLRDLSSLGLANFIRHSYPQTRVIIMTTCRLDVPALDKNIKELRQSGVCQFIAKPFDLSDLLGLVNHLLGSEDEMHSGFRYTPVTAGRRTRKCRRAAVDRYLPFQLAVISQGQTQRWVIEARTTDISDTGIGLTTRYPLKATQVVSFGKPMDERTGIVVWSSMVDEKTCRAGIKFC